jgi:hypothetical protein
MEVTGNVMINELTILINWLFQEGFGRLWRGTNAGMALAVPTVSSCLVDSVMLLVICYVLKILFCCIWSILVV